MNQESPASASATGTDTDEVVTVGEIEKATERAFKYQRYIARRTFALYYLVWAAAILLVLVSLHLSTLVALVIRLTALAGAAGITAVILRDARRILMLRRPLGGEEAIYSHYTGSLIIWMYVVAAVYIVVSLYFPAPALPAYSHSVFYALLLPMPFLFYRLMSLAFPDRRPPEGLIALATFAVVAVVSLDLSLFGLPSRGYTPQALMIVGVTAATAEWWFLAASVWFLAACYALYRAPHELEALRS